MTRDEAEEHFWEAFQENDEEFFCAIFAAVPDKELIRLVENRILQDSINEEDRRINEEDRNAQSGDN